MRVEAAHALRQHARTLQKIMGNEGLENVQLEIAGRATKIDGNIIAEHLAA